MHTKCTHDETRIMRVLNLLKKKKRIIRWKKSTLSAAGHSRYRITLINGQLLHILLVYKSVAAVAVLVSKSDYVKIVLPPVFSLREFALLILRESYHRCKGTNSEQRIKKILLSEKIQLPNAFIFEVTKTKKKEDINGIDFIITLCTQSRTLITVPLQVKSSKEAQEKHKQIFPTIPSVVSSHDDVLLEHSLCTILSAYTTDPVCVLHL